MGHRFVYTTAASDNAQVREAISSRIRNDGEAHSPQTLEKLGALGGRVLDTMVNVHKFGSSIGIDMRLESLGPIILSPKCVTEYRIADRSIRISLETEQDAGEQVAIHEFGHHVQNQHSVIGKLDYIFHMAHLEAGTFLFTAAYYDREKSPDARLIGAKRILKLAYMNRVAKVTNDSKDWVDYVLATGLAYAACILKPDVDDLTRMFMTMPRKEVMDELAGIFERRANGSGEEKRDFDSVLGMLRQGIKEKPPIRWTVAAWMADVDMFGTGSGRKALLDFGTEAGLGSDIVAIGQETRGALLCDEWMG
jgi:hypothetical protein